MAYGHQESGKDLKQINKKAKRHCAQKLLPE